MEIISIGHVCMEKEVFDPYCWIGGAIVRFYINGLKPCGELMFHYPVWVVDRVDHTSEPRSISSDIRGEPWVGLVSAMVVPVYLGIVAVKLAGARPLDP